LTGALSAISPLPLTRLWQSAPLASFSPLVAKRLWLSFNLLLLGGTLLLMRGMTPLPLRRISLLAFLATIPLRTNFQFGQQHLLILFLFALAGWFYLARGAACRAERCWLLGRALKVYPAFFGVFFLLKGRWRALAGLCVAFVLLIAIGVAAVRARAAPRLRNRRRSSFTRGRGQRSLLPGLQHAGNSAAPYVRR